MKYEFKPFKISIEKRRNYQPVFYFNIVVSTYDFCSGSYGLLIDINICFFKFLTILIKPLGELKAK